MWNVHVIQIQVSYIRHVWTDSWPRDYEFKNVCKFKTQTALYVDNLGLKTDFANINVIRT